MNFRERLSFLLTGNSKESLARTVSTVNQLGKPVSTPANYEGFARQGYSKNLIVYAAISKIATACKGVNWVVYSKRRSSNGKLTELENHPLLDLLAKPNPLQARAAFIESVVGFKLIAGNSYIESNRGLKTSGPALELWPVRPDRMKVIGGPKGYPAAYEFSVGGDSRRWPVNPIDFSSDIMHWKSFNPLNDWYGLSALEAAMLTLDQNNAGNKWNLALTQNSATPSGVLQMKATEYNPRGELSNEQYARIKREFEESYQGARNAGRPLLIEGGLAWQSISLSPKDMDFIQSRNLTSIDLCIALGVPPELMGMGQKTFNNYAEARLSFYDETVLPLLDDLRDALNASIVKPFGEDLYLDYDRDGIEALRARSTMIMGSLKDVGFLTVNEKRAQIGYDEIEGGDELDKPQAQAFGGGGDLTEEDEDQEEESQESDVEASESEDDLEDEDDKTFHWKSINLLNANEKRKSWKRQNAWRNRIASSFSKDLKEDFLTLADKLSKTASELSDREPRVIEFALIKTLDDWSNDYLAKTLRTHIRMTLTDFGDMVLGEGKSLGFDKENKANLKFDGFVKEYVSRHTATQIRTITSSNEKTIRRVVSQYVEDAITDGDDLPNLSARLQSKFGELSDYQANRIARTEVGMASTQGSLEAIKSLSIPNMFKEWVSASDARVRDGENGGPDHAIVNGQEVPVDEKFSVPPDTLMEGPGDPSAPADQVINCRCVVTFRSKN